MNGGIIARSRSLILIIIIIIIIMTPSLILLTLYPLLEDYPTMGILYSKQLQAY